MTRELYDVPVYGLFIWMDHLYVRLRDGVDSEDHKIPAREIAGYWPYENLWKPNFCDNQTPFNNCEVVYLGDMWELLTQGLSAVLRTYDDDAHCILSQKLKDSLT